MSIVSFGKIHVGDSGTDFRLLVQETSSNDINEPVDLTTATAKIIITDPSGVETIFDAVIIAPATSGVISFVNTDNTFFDDASFWFYRAKIIDGATEFESNDALFEVLGKQQ